MRILKKTRILAAMLVFASIAVIGCGTKNEQALETDIEVEQSVSENSLEVEEENEFSDLSQELIDNVPKEEDYESFTQKDLFSMSKDEFRAFIYVYCPNYRDVFNISKDKVMEDTDWESLRSLVSYQFFGSLWDVSNVKDNYELAKKIADKYTMTDEEKEKIMDKFVNPSDNADASNEDEDDASEITPEEEIQELEYFEKIIQYATPEEILELVYYSVLEETEEELDFSNITEEEVEELRNGILDEINDVKKELMIKNTSDNISDKVE